MTAQLAGYPRRKQTGLDWLGPIPEDWDVVRAKYVFEEVNERSVDGSEELLSVSEYWGVKPRAGAIGEGEPLTRAETLEGYKKCSAGDLVMNIMLAWKRGLGVASQDGIVSPSYSVFRLRLNSEPKYFDYLLRTDLYTMKFWSKSTGIMDSRLRLYPDDFGEIELIVPPLEEQRQIVEFLDYETARIDLLIAKHIRLIELLYEERLAAVSTAFQRGDTGDQDVRRTGIPWYPRTPQSWTMTTVKRHFGVELGKMLDEKRFSLGGTMMPYLRTSNVGWDQIDLSDVSEMPFHSHEFDRYSTRPGDLLVCEGGDAGRTTMWREEWGTMMIQKAINRVRAIGDVNPRFAYYWFWYVKHVGGVDWMCNGTTILHFTADKVKEAPLPVPPTTEEQSAIIRRLDEVFNSTEAALNSARSIMSVLEERRRATILAAATGDVDVRSWVSPDQEFVLGG